MNDTIIVGILGIIGTTIVGPYVSYILTNKSKEKEKQNALENLHKTHNHEMETLRVNHEHEMKFKELEFQKEIQIKEKNLEITKEKLKAEVESTNSIEQNSAITKIASSFLKEEFKNPDSDFGKQIKEAAKHNTRKHVVKRNKG